MERFNNPHKRLFDALDDMFESIKKTNEKYERHKRRREGNQLPQDFILPSNEEEEDSESDEDSVDSKEDSKKTPTHSNSENGMYIMYC